MTTKAERQRWLSEIENRACRAKDGSGDPADVLADGTLALVRELRRLDPSLAPDDGFITVLRDVGHAQLDEVAYLNEAAKVRAHEALDDVLDSAASYISLHGNAATRGQA